MGRRPGQGRRGALRRVVALGGGLLLRPLSMVWRAGLRFFRSKKDMRDRATAARARKDWRDDAPRSSRLRRAVDHAVGAVYAALLPGRRALAVLLRALSVLQRKLSVSLQRALAFGRCLLSPRRPCQEQRAGRTPPPPPPPPHTPRNARAILYGSPCRQPNPAASSASSSSSSPRQQETFEVDGVVVTEEAVNQYATYCSEASTCPAKWTVCNFCFFEFQRVPKCRVKTSEMCIHCYNQHRDEDGRFGIECDEAGCSVRVRPGPDQALHIYFCHRRPHGWWTRL